MNIKQLKSAINDLPDEYEVEISINEEGDVINHFFIDNDLGVLEITNFKEEDGILNDVFDNELNVGTKVLYYDYSSNTLLCGTIINIDMDAGRIEIRNKLDNKTHIEYLDNCDGRLKVNRIVKYNY